MSIGIFAGRSVCIFGMAACCYEQSKLTKGVQDYSEKSKESKGEESLEQKGQNLFSAFNTTIAPVDTLA